MSAAQAVQQHMLRQSPAYATPPPVEMTLAAGLVHCVLEAGSPLTMWLITPSAGVANQQDMLTN